MLSNTMNCLYTRSARAENVGETFDSKGVPFCSGIVGWQVDKTWGVFCAHVMLRSIWLPRSS